MANEQENVMTPQTKNSSQEKETTSNTQNEHNETPPANPPGHEILERIGHNKSTNARIGIWIGVKESINSRARIVLNKGLLWHGGGTLKASWPMPRHKVLGRPLARSWDLTDPHVFGNLGGLRPRTKRLCGSEPPYDPHVSRKILMERVGIIEEAKQPLDNGGQRVREAEVLVVDEGAESFDTKFEVKPLSGLSQPSVIGLDHVLVQSSEAQVLDAGSQGDMWVSPSSCIPAKTFHRILASGLVRGVHDEMPTRDQRAHRLTFGWMAWAKVALTTRAGDVASSSLLPPPLGECMVEVGQPCVWLFDLASHSKVGRFKMADQAYARQLSMAGQPCTR
uniref:Uncharacterized protein n=1 Tax=Cannabis sativa TaxID=3483 RepID=A0A803NP39_CANSA